MARSSAALAVGVLSALVNAQAFYGGDQSVCTAAEAFVDLGCYLTNLQTTLTPFTPNNYDPANPEGSYPGFDSGTNYNATVTPQVCVTTCRGYGYRTATLFDGTCGCGYDVPGLLNVLGGNCDTPCPGDASQSCGGAAATEVYVDPSFADNDQLAAQTPADIAAFYQYLGCFNDVNAFPTEATAVSLTNQPSIVNCLNACASLRYPLARATALG